MWVQIALFIFSTVLSYILAPKPPKPKDASKGKLDIPHPPNGEPISVVFGSVWKEDAGVIHYGNPKTKAIMSEGGGKK